LRDVDLDMRFEARGADGIQKILVRRRARIGFQVEQLRGIVRVDGDDRAEAIVSGNLANMTVERPL